MNLGVGFVLINCPACGAELEAQVAIESVKEADYERAISVKFRPVTVLHRCPKPPDPPEGG